MIGKMASLGSRKSFELYQSLSSPKPLLFLCTVYPIKRVGEDTFHSVSLHITSEAVRQKESVALV